MVYVIDTHALVWFIEKNDRLGKKALEIMRDETKKLIIPSIVLAEIRYLSFKQRIESSFNSILSAVEDDSRCVVYSLDSNIVEAMPLLLNIHDGIICGTALVYQNLLKEMVKVITKDEEISKSRSIEVVW
ncbi:MAG: PIN domain-containing protein [bacterium]|nr:PIN domain-containing protein [bacterium]